MKRKALIGFALILLAVLILCISSILSTILIDQISLLEQRNIITITAFVYIALIILGLFLIASEASEVFKEETKGG